MFRKRRFTKKQIRLRQILDSYHLVDLSNEDDEPSRMIIDYLCDYYDGMLYRSYISDKSDLVLWEAPRIIYPYKVDYEVDPWLRYLCVSLGSKRDHCSKLIFGLGEGGSFGVLNRFGPCST